MKTRYFFILLIVSTLVKTTANAQSNTPCSSGSICAPPLTVSTPCSYITGTTDGATVETDIANGGTPSCGFIMGEDAWYSFVAPSTGSVSISTAAGSILDGVMVLYSGTCDNWTEIACNDDAFGAMPQISYAQLNPGETYLIRFWQYGGGTGTFDICVELKTPPPNEDCSVQFPICSGIPIDYIANAGETPAFTLNPNNDYGCLITTPNPTWYYLQIATGGDLVVDLTALADIDFAIYGPFVGLAEGISACDTYGPPLDCSYSPDPVEQVNVAGVVTGEVYALLVTNYANTVQNINVTNAGGTATTNCAIVLPVGYTQWNANIDNGQVSLNWTTESESNCDYYVVQRSVDAFVWETLGFVDGHGSTSEAHQYNYTDQQPKDGMNYYRLMQVDHNGISNYTTILPVEVSSNISLNVFPNPAKGTINVRNFDNQIDRVVLIDNIGRTIVPEFTTTEDGVSINCSSSQKGTYILQCLDEGGNIHNNLVVIE